MKHISLGGDIDQSLGVAGLHAGLDVDIVSDMIVVRVDIEEVSGRVADHRLSAGNGGIGIGAVSVRGAADEVLGVVVNVGNEVAAVIHDSAAVGDELGALDVLDDIIGSRAVVTLKSDGAVELAVNAVHGIAPVEAVGTPVIGNKSLIEAAAGKACVIATSISGGEGLVLPRRGEGEGIRQGVDGADGNSGLVAGEIHQGSGGLTKLGGAGVVDDVNENRIVVADDVGSTDQVAVGIEVPGVVGDLVSGLIEVEANVVVVGGAADNVLGVVGPDGGLSADDAGGLAVQLDMLLGGSVDDLGVSILNSIDKDHVTLGILIVRGAVGLGHRGGRVINSGGGADSTRVVDIHGDGRGGLQVTGGIEGSIGNIGDLCEQGVDVDDAILVDLGQTALSADLVDRVDGVEGLLGGVVNAVGVNGELLGVLEAIVLGDLALGHSLSVGLDRGGLDGGVVNVRGVLLITGGLVVLAVPGVVGTAPSVDLIGELGQAEVLLAEGGVGLAVGPRMAAGVGVAESRRCR